MKRLNPLYIVLLSLTILIASFYSINKEKLLFNEKVKNYEQLSVKAKEYKSLKSSWDDERFVNRTLDSILKSRSFRGKKVLRVKANKAIKLKLESNDPKVLNRFLNKILNKKLIIKKLTLDKSYISLEIGVR